MVVSCESDGERYIRAQNVINKMTTLETDIKSNNIQFLLNPNIIYMFF